MADPVADGAAEISRVGIWRPAISLAVRENVRFMRQRNRVIGAALTPVVFWLIIGLGMNRSFTAANSDGYLPYFLPGAVAMAILFTAIFSTISIIEDRREGLLQGILVSPAPRSAIVLGKILGGTLLALVQATMVLSIAPLAGVWISTAGWLLALGVMAVMGAWLTAVGVAIAWPMRSTQGYHAIMNVVLMPMWMLSGALFPPEGAATALRGVMYANPMTYSVSALRSAMNGQLPTPLDAGVTLAVLVATFVIATAVVRREA